jgi:hypothetical protein
MAAVKRQLALEGEHLFSSTSTPSEPCQTASTKDASGQEEDDSDSEELHETDQERRQIMMDSMDTSEADQLKTGTLSDIWGSFILPKRPLDKVPATESKATCVNPQGAKNASTHAPLPPAPKLSTARAESSKFQPRKLPQEQARDGKRILGQAVPHQERTFDATLPNSTTRGETLRNVTWSCLVCTLSVVLHLAFAPNPESDPESGVTTLNSSDNEPEHLACSACATPRGDALCQHLYI